MRVIKVDPVAPSERKIKEAAGVIKEGGLVAFPTETVYGVGANALNEEAVKKLFEIKKRPPDKPLSLLIGRKEDLGQYVEELPEVARALIEVFWPGPLTVVLKASSLIPGIMKNENNTVGIRLPDCRVAREIVRVSGVPLACPSANLSGSASPTRAEEVIKELGGKIDLLLDGGETRIGVASTVLDVTGPVAAILREGALKKEEIEKVIRKVL
jgi:L-threonylcarbamoyladenylate synthase